MVLTKFQLDELEKVHLPLIGDTKKVNKRRIAIAFSGLPGAGKSTLARIIAERYGALVINNDVVRGLIENTFNLTDRNDIQQAMLQYYEVRLIPILFSANNGISILDSAIDRKYTLMEKFYSDAGYDFYVIGMDIPRQQVEAQLKQRETTNLNAYLALLDNAANDVVAFRKIRTPDFIITKNSQAEINQLLLDLDRVLEYQH